MRIRKLNQRGFDHVVGIVLFVVCFAMVGTVYLFLAHAATTSADVQLRLNGDDVCFAGSIVDTCNTINPEMAYAQLTGSNFQIKNAEGLCVDDWNHAYQSIPGNQGGTRIMARFNTCYNGDANQEWNWNGHELANVGNQGAGCLDAAGANATSGTEVIIYSCNGQWNQDWYENAAYKTVKVPTAATPAVTTTPAAHAPTQTTTTTTTTTNSSSGALPSTTAIANLYKSGNYNTSCSDIAEYLNKGVALAFSPGGITGIDAAYPYCNNQSSQCLQIDGEAAADVRSGRLTTASAIRAKYPYCYKSM